MYIYNRWMELLKKYIEEITKDLYLDDFNIKESQMRLPAKKHFWVARLMDAKINRNSFIKKKSWFNHNTFLKRKNNLKKN